MTTPADRAPHNSPRLTGTLGRVLTAAVLVSSATVAGPTWSQPAHAAGKPGACAKGEGVTVIVQDPNNNVMRCSPGDPANGEEALKGAGFTIVHNYSGLICQIGYGDIMYPQECPQLPMPYWSYWQAQHPGDSWYYSDWGAITYDPDIDDFEGWRFGVGHTTPNNGIVPLYAGQSGPQPAPAPPENMPRGVVPSGDSGVNDGSWDGGDYSDGDPNHPGETFTPSPTTTAPAPTSPPTSSRPDPTTSRPTTKSPQPTRTDAPRSTAPRPTSAPKTSAPERSDEATSRPATPDAPPKSSTEGSTGSRSTDGSAPRSSGEATDDTSVRSSPQPTAPGTADSGPTGPAQAGTPEANRSSQNPTGQERSSSPTSAATAPQSAAGESEADAAASSSQSPSSSSQPVPTSEAAASDPAAPVGEPTRNENAAGPSGEAPGSGYGSLLLTGGLLAAVAAGVGAWLRFGRR